MPGIPAVLAPWRWPHFTPDELRCRCGCGRVDMAPDFLDRLEQLRVAFGRPLSVCSGFRCPAHNANPLVSHSGDRGPHTTGRAVDIRIGRGDAYALNALAPALGFTGIGFAQKGDARFIHLDDLPDAPGQPRPTVWSY